MPPHLHEIQVNVNGAAHASRVEPRLLLSDYLRHELGLTGTHIGCEHGVCGACTVLLDGQPVRSCLIFAVQADGAEGTTVEALGTVEALSTRCCAMTPIPLTKRSATRSVDTCAAAPAIRPSSRRSGPRHRAAQSDR